MLVAMAYSDNVLRISWWDDEVDSIEECDALTLRTFSCFSAACRLLYGSLSCWLRI